ncbi:carbohydrate-binding protein [Paenibacillus zeisoli]|uniref:Carbohydrate-binding protein n=1 Tax=Paenibacillus zeisoli TaxID=2496267 RepID=A0A3S1D407_9BACL|nr:glycoside hydrolase family 3 protein [Paenibacillus zeisoli]RUT36544.1 carbohydrate-binding protein [Paenibacillus zeisoli]
MTSANAYPYLNPDLSLEERVADLVSRLTLDEKIEQMCQYQAEIPRLNIQAYKHGTEGAHGVAWLGEATVFPQNTGLACTWDPELMRQIGSVIGDEARVYYQKDPKINGLTIWAPTVDMERDPRWGRTEEAYGEDPYLTGRLTTELVKGMQGDDPFYFKTVATLKHFYANNNEVDRGSASVSIDPRNKREYYLKAFEPTFKEGGAASMMTAYNGINGVPCNVNPEINDIVKGEWGMKGFVVGDAGDVLGTVNDHHYVESYAEAVARSVKNGIDSITDDQDISFRALRDALEQGHLTEADLDHALQNTFRVRFRLGEFDPAERNPYAHVEESKLCAEDHAKLSKQAALEGVVLLKNTGILPLRKEIGSVAVIGPMANEAHTDWYSGTPKYRITPLEGIISQLNEGRVRYCDGSDRIRIRSLKTGKYVVVGNEEQGHGLTAAEPSPEKAAIFRRTDWGWGSETLREDTSGKFVTENEEGFLSATAEEARGWFVKEVFQIQDQEEGLSGITNWQGVPVAIGGDRELRVNGSTEKVESRFAIEVVSDGIAEAVEAARASEAAIVFAGNIPFINGKETIDRMDITLPSAQQQLIQAVMEANPNTIVVLVGSYPFAVNWEQEHVPAILYTSHAGPELGAAAAEVLFGEYNPAGRLAMTWYRSQDQLPDIMDYDIIKGKRTYQYFEGEVLYPFGHGLSYTEFEYSGIHLSRPIITKEDELVVSITITNSGSLAGEEVVQLYVHADQSRVPRPLKTLSGFKRLSIVPGASETIEFKLSTADLSYWDVTRERYVMESGTYTIMAGSSSKDIKASVVITAEGEEVPPRSLTSPVKAENYDDYEGVYLDECIEGGSSVRTREESGWIAFWDVELGEQDRGVLKARVSCMDPGAEIEVRLDEAAGQLAGRSLVPPTGGTQAWTTLEIPLEGINGRHSVYLLLKGSILISKIHLE